MTEKKRDKEGEGETTLTFSCSPLNPRASFSPSRARVSRAWKQKKREKKKRKGKKGTKRGEEEERNRA